MKKHDHLRMPSLGDRSPLGMCDTLVGAAAFVAAYATAAGWQIAFWGIDPDHPDCADAILRKDGARRAFFAPNHLTLLNDSAARRGKVGRENRDCALGVAFGRRPPPILYRKTMDPHRLRHRIEWIIVYRDPAGRFSSGP